MQRKADLHCDVLIEHAAELITVAPTKPGPKRGDDLQNIGIVSDGAIAIQGDRILAVGPTEDVRAQVVVDDRTTIIDATGKTVMPGFVDPHTHVVHGGSREFELPMRLAGRSYIDILNEGGGILNTVAQTQDASVDELVRQTRRRLGIMLAHGTTTVESKSGYGLTTEGELRQLEANARLAQSQPARIVSTFMGAHAIPPAYKDDPDGFVDLVVEEMIPAVARWNARPEASASPEESLWGMTAEFNDVFCERDVFTVEQSRRILEAGRSAGMAPKIHAEEIVNFGGARLAAELGAVSADHLVHASEDDVAALAEAGVVAVLLPATTLFLMGDTYAPARAMIEAGVPVALATDCNPGSSPTESMQLVVALACLQLRMQPVEAIAAATLNAAHAIGRGEEIGSLEPGKLADIVVLDAPSHEWIPYKPGVNLVERVLVGGRIVVERSVTGV